MDDKILHILFRVVKVIIIFTKYLNYCKLINNRYLNYQTYGIESVP